jgi:hypothetical protein
MLGTSAGIGPAVAEAAGWRHRRKAIENTMLRIIVPMVIALAASSSAAQAPLKVHAKSGRMCTALAPPDWSFTGENAAGGGFGADMQRADGRAVASYFIVGVAGGMRTSPTYGRWYATPQQAAMATLSQLGTVPVQCGAPSAPLPGVSLMQCRTPQYVGVALYQVFPMQDNGFVLVMRTAGATPDIWQREGMLVSAVSRSIRCNVPLKPTSFDYTSGLGESGKSRRIKPEGKSDYSRWSGMENVHDPATGQNYWAEAGRDWRENGPKGPGYYANVNGEERLLSPGRSN